MSVYNLNTQAAAFTHLRQLLTLTNNQQMVPPIKKEIQSILQKLGQEGEKFFFVNILRQLDDKKQDKQSVAAKSQLLMALLEELSLINTYSRFPDYFSIVVEQVTNGEDCIGYVKNMFQNYRMKLALQIVVSISLVLSTVSRISEDGIVLLKQKLQEYFEQGQPLVFPDYQVSLLLYIARTNNELKDFKEQIKYIIDTNKQNKDYQFRPLLSEFPQVTQDTSDLEPIENILSPVGLFKDLGPQCTLSAANLKAVFQDFDLNEEYIYQCIEHMAQTTSQTDDQTSKTINNLYQVSQKKNFDDWQKFANEDINDKKHENQWNKDNFINCCQQLLPDMSWANVMRRFDRPDLGINSEQEFLNIMAFFKHARKVSNFVWPSQIFTKKWKYPQSQIKFVNLIITIGEPDHILFHEVEKRVVNLDFNSQLKYSQLKPVQLQFWACLDILELLVELSVTADFLTIRKLFDNPITSSSDILIVGLSQMRVKKGHALIDELLSQLFPIYLSQHVNSIPILEQIWKNNEEFLISAICELYKRENKKENTSLNLSRVLDITQNISDSLIKLSNWNDYDFSVNLGILAGKREFLHFDSWIQERLKNIGDPFISSLLTYIEEQVISQIRQYNQKYNGQYTINQQYENILEKAQLNIQLLTLIFEFLILQNASTMSIKNQIRLVDDQQMVRQFFPSLQSPPETNSQEIEQIANSYFQKLYKEEIKVSEFVQMMKRFKTSSKSQDKEVCACMITGLLDEYRFHEHYPQKELQITGEVFGDIIINEIIEGRALQIALDAISQSLQQKGKRIDFGIKALITMKSKLQNFPQFIEDFEQMIKVPKNMLLEKYPDVIEEIIKVLESGNYTMKLEPNFKGILFQQIELLKTDKSYKPVGNGEIPVITQENGTAEQDFQIAQQQLLAQQQQKNAQIQMQYMAGNTLPQQPVQQQPVQNLTTQQQLLAQISVQNVGGQFQSMHSQQQLPQQPAMANIIPQISQQQPQVPQNLQQQQQQQQPQYKMQNNSLQMFHQIWNVMLKQSSEIRSKINQDIDRSLRIELLPPFQYKFAQIKFSVMVQTLKEKLIPKISDESKAKINFALNNLTQKNIDKLAGDIEQVILDQPVVESWFIVHVVYEKILNNDQLQEHIISLIIKMDIKGMFQKVLNVSMDLFKQTIYIDQAFSTSEKKMVKLLGTWIGSLTLARNKPISYTYVNLKTLLCNISMVEEKIQQLIPLICYIIKCTKNTRFSSNSPWLKPILKILEEMTKKINKNSINIEILLLFEHISYKPENVKDFKMIQQIITKQMSQYYPSIQNLSVQQPELVQEEIQPQQSQVPQPQGMGKLNIAQLPEFISIDTNQLKQFSNLNLQKIVSYALDQAISETLPPVINRSVSIALITTKELALKDFGLEPDPKTVFKGIQFMLSKLSSSLALVSCRDPLKQALQQNLKNLLDQQSVLSEDSKNTIIESCIQSNIDLGCSLIRKVVQDKAIDDVGKDPQILESLEKRKKAQQKDEQYTDMKYVKQVEFLPDVLKPQVGGLLAEDLKIYDNFSASSTSRIQERTQPRETIDNYQQDVLQKLQVFLKTFVGQKINKEDYQGLLYRTQEFFKEIKHSNQFFYELIKLIMIQMVFQQNPQVEQINIYLDVLEKMKQVYSKNIKAEEFSQGIQKVILEEKLVEKLTSQLLNLIVNCLKKGLLLQNDFDNLLISMMKRYPKSVRISIFVTSIVVCLVQQQQVLQLQEMMQIIQCLKHHYQNCGEKNEQVQLFLTQAAQIMPELELASYNSQNFNQLVVNSHRQLNRNIQLYRQIFEQLDKDFCMLAKRCLEEWLTLSTETQIQNYIKKIETEILPNDDNGKKYYIYVLDICISYAINSQVPANRLVEFPNLDLSYIDSFSKQFTVLLKSAKQLNKNSVLEKICESILIVTTKWHEEKPEEFNQRPVFKLLMNMICDFTRTEYQFSENDILNMFIIMSQLFVQLSPLSYPGFAFAWLELISNRYFAPVLLKDAKGQEHYSNLIVELLRFYKETVTDESFQTDFMQSYYKGSLRVFLILLHDYPSFLCEYAYVFCDEIPTQFIQVKNIILACFPKNIQPPDPFQVMNPEKIEDFNTHPAIKYPQYDNIMNQINLENEVQQFAQRPSEIQIQNILNMFTDKQSINKQVINVFAIAIPKILNQYQIPQDTLHSLITYILKYSTPRLREEILQSIIQHIRYPNRITVFYIEFILKQFKEQENDQIQEQITRIFVERLIVKKPHPWGVIYTFLELCKKPAYKFKEKSYIDKNEIQKLFKILFQSIYPPVKENTQYPQQQYQQQMQPQQQGANAQQIQNPGENVNRSQYSQNRF